MTQSVDDIIADFCSAMRSHGIDPEFGRDGLVPDGAKIIRFHVAGDRKGTRNGWCVLFTDGVPAGEFGDFRTGVRETWCSKSDAELTDAERKEKARRIEAARAEREREQKQAEGDAAKLANLIWRDAQPAPDDHPYLVRKRVASHGLRVTAWPMRDSDGAVFRYIENTLLIPIMDTSGKITSLQAIFPAPDEFLGRDKDFLRRGKKQKCFYMLGTPPGDGGTVAFAEGYATAATIHRLTGWCVIVCWDAYNIPPVTEAMRALMPRCVFVVCADNDQFTSRPVNNPGVTLGKQAAASVRARIVWPVFANLDGKPTDFNDLSEREGDDTARAQLLPKKLARSDSDATPVVRADGYVSPVPVLGIDTFTPFDDIDGKGKPLPTPTNLAEMLRRIGGTVRYNVIAKDVEIDVPNARNTVDNQANAAHAELLGWAARMRMSTANFDGNLVACADANLYNPVATWIESTPWDGRSRLADFFATITVKNDRKLPGGGSLKDALMRRWMVSAVAAAFSPNGVVARGVLTFVSKQNLGKTFWAKRLAPQHLDVIADGLILNPADKDSVMSCVSKWIVELGEVDATFRRSDIAALKAFVSRDKDALRRPYAKAESKFARRTVFFASVNDPQFLRDATGNTRWWALHITAIDNAHTIDVQQVWAEVLGLFRAGELWHLTHDEVAALNESNRNFEESSPVHDMIDSAFDWDTLADMWAYAMSATDIAVAAGVEKPTKRDVNEAAAYVVQAYGVEKRKVGKLRSLAWLMPPRKHMARDTGGPF